MGAVHRVCTTDDSRARYTRRRHSVVAARECERRMAADKTERLQRDTHDPSSSSASACIMTHIHLPIHTSVVSLHMHLELCLLRVRSNVHSESAEAFLMPSW